MRYTDAEKQKIVENLDKIVGWIETEVYPNIREMIYVNFGSNSISINIKANGEPEIIGRCGNNLSINFNHEDVKGLYYNSASVYNLDSVASSDYAVSLITGWSLIKPYILDMIADQQAVIETINNFEV